MRTLCLLVALFVLGASGSEAATLLVTTHSDVVAIDGRCSLREAVLSANSDTAINDCPAGSGHDIIELGAQTTYNLARAGTNEDMAQFGDLDIRWHTTIRPADPGVTVEINAQGLDRVFDVFDGAELTLERIEVTGGDVIGFGGGIFSQDPDSHVRLIDSRVANNAASLFGGGLFSEGPATIERSEIEFNDAVAGAGIYMGTAAPLVLIDSQLEDNDALTDGGGVNAVVVAVDASTFAHNDAARGGGLFVRSDARRGLPVSTLTNTTLAENGSNGDGGGVYVQSNGDVHFNSSTIAWNTCDDDESGDGDGCGLYVDSGLVTVENTIIAANEDRSNGGPPAPDCVGPVTSAGYNLLGGVDLTVCIISGDMTGNHVGSNLAPLDAGLNCIGSNGGPTRTVLPLATSPAVDAGRPSGCDDASGVALIVDQRGFERIWDGPDADMIARCDIGAAELDAPEYSDILFIGNFDGDEEQTAEGRGGSRGGCFE